MRVNPIECPECGENANFHNQTPEERAHHECTVCDWWDFADPIAAEGEDRSTDAQD
jgi:hypothetical protein